MTSRVTCSPREVTASEFPPHELRDYALLADGERGAAIGPRGEVAWLCAPRWESGSVFSSLIGVYAISPATRFVWSGFCEPGSLIWHSRWITDERVIIECREALALPGRGLVTPLAAPVRPGFESWPLLLDVLLDRLALDLPNGLHRLMPDRQFAARHQ